MRVAYQAGVIRALEEAGLSFFHADGTSGGTINLAMLFSGLTPDEMCHRWRTLNVHDFVSLLPLREYLKGLAVPAMGDADGIVNKVFPHLGIDVGRINAATGMSGTFNVCNFARKTNEAIPNDRVDRDLLVAGISLPLFMPAVKKGDALYLDSVWIKDANLLEAVARGADELWVVWCIGNTPHYRGGPFYQYVHMIELSANGALFEEFERIRELNQRIAAGEAIVPVDSSPLALQGLGRLKETARIILDMTGHLVRLRPLTTLYDPRTRVCREVHALLRSEFGADAIAQPIRYSVKLREKIGKGRIRSAMTPSGSAALDYGALASQIVAEDLAGPVPEADHDVVPVLTRADGGAFVSFAGRSPEEVLIAGDFNAWVPDGGVKLERDSRGRWRKFIQMAPGTHQYRFILRGQWVSDPRNPHEIMNGFGSRNSIVHIE